MRQGNGKGSSLVTIRARAKGHLLVLSGIDVDRVKFILEFMGKMKEKLGDGLLLGLRRRRCHRGGGEAHRCRPSLILLRTSARMWQVWKGFLLHDLVGEMAREGGGVLYVRESSREVRRRWMMQDWVGPGGGTWHSFSTQELLADSPWQRSGQSVVEEQTVRGRKSCNMDGSIQKLVSLLQSPKLIFQASKKFHQFLC